mmetsp:Transcript_6456/g.5767  ORF Transcript_6456/g.5767 Transcript_6456/m.5767 type:complete len:92 (+) Transcript_6456:1082-1357(+)
MMEHKNPVVRLMIYGKIKRTINSFKEEKLKEKEMNLIKGIYINKLKDIDNEHKEKLENKSLLDRVRGELFQRKPPDDKSESSSFGPESDLQ